MLFEIERHEALTPTPWDTGRAHEALVAIVDDIERSQQADHTWPTHPRDDEEPRGLRHKSLYLGAAGALWALHYLAREGAVTLRSTPAESMDAIHAAYLASPDIGEVVPSYYLGEVGILLVAWRLKASRDTADRLHACIEANIGNPTNEALWAAPGTMVGAWHMLEWTGEPRWRELFLRNVEQLWRTWLPDDNSPFPLWTQDMYGRIWQMLGAGHGFAGNVYPLLRGAALLPAEQREALFERCEAMLASTALIDGDCANWPPIVGKAGADKILVQWCHGSPGIVTAFADFPKQRSSVVDDLLVQAGNLVWSAGPLTKGHGLCHGTAGNGYAFLKLYRRTGDTVWLDRARAFAMHASLQRDAMQLQHGQGRYTLWTGDAGLAVYLWHCLQGQADLPGLDLL
jgi:hypothetical protein